MITEDHLGEINDIIRRASELEEHLNEFEKVFIGDWEERLACTGVSIVISDKQQFIFEGIDRKLKQLAAVDRDDDVGDRTGYSAALDLCAEIRGSSPSRPA